MFADARTKLVRQLRIAYSAELGAGYAYRGHWHSVRDAADRQHIRQIESEEWHHRELVGGLLQELGETHSRLREIIFWIIGHAIGIFCHIGGWFAPMYGAGRLERGNIVEYEDAAVFAAECGHDEMIDCLLTMAEVEWDHEAYFRKKAASHPFVRILKLWPPTQPREAIRARFEASEKRGDAVA